MTTPRVLVVGTGPSGLAALKEMRESGLEAMAVDVRSTFGGVFAPDSGVTFDNLHLTISNVFMSFSDFPAHDVDKGVKYWSQAEYFDYLAAYVDHFQLRQHMQLETSVDKANFNEAIGEWEVSLTDYSNTDQPVVINRNFDKLIVASGANHTPKLPEAFKDFKGEVLHSSEYHSAQQLKGKKVLIIGMGEGGSDVASSAVETADSVTVWGRRFPDCAPRFLEPFLHDQSYDEHQHLPLHHKPNGLLETITISRTVRNLPLGLWSVALHGLTTSVKKKHGLNSSQGIGGVFTARAWSADYYSSDTSMVPTKSAVTLTAAARGLLDIVITQDATIEDNKVSFQNAQVFGGGGKGAAAEPTSIESHELDIDVIVACTGFDLKFDWITTSGAAEGPTPNPRTWFKHCFPPGMGENLAFVGFARPHSGGIPQCSEMISRYIAQLYQGNRTLPADYANLAIEEAAAERDCFNLTPDYHVLVDYVAYMMSVAKLVGCTPRSLPPLSAPLDAVKYWTFPLWPCFFRTQGVGAKPDTVDAVLKKFGPFDALPPMPLLVLQLLCSIFLPFVNLFAYVVNAVLPSKKEHGLPRLYQWRSSKAHFMYKNSLTASDFKIVFTQWLATVFVIGHLGIKALKSIVPKLRNAETSP